VHCGTSSRLAAAQAWVGSSGRKRVFKPVIAGRSAERIDEAIQLDRHSALRAPRDDKGV